MKKILFAILLFVLPVMTKATSQIAEKIIINGEKWDLLHCPIALDSILYEKVEELTSKNTEHSTGCYRGYIGTWELKNDRLFLRNISFDLWDDGKVAADSTNLVWELFEPYRTDEGIFASWVTDTLRIGRGEWLEYDDWGFDRNYEQESFLVIERGVILNRKDYRNYKKEGVSWRDIEKSLNAAFPLRLHRQDDEYTCVLIKDVVLDDSANIVDCKLEIETGRAEWLRDQNHPDILKLKEVLKRHAPWTYLYINGKVQTYDCRMYMYNAPFFWKKIEGIMNNIYNDVKRMAYDGYINSDELVDKYCSKGFRYIYHEAYGWATENNELIFDFCHWTRAQDYEKPEFKFVGVDDRNIKECNYKMMVMMEKTDTIGGRDVSQKFFVKMKMIGGRWWIDDFQTPGEKSDAVILKSNLEKAKSTM